MHRLKVRHKFLKQQVPVNFKFKTKQPERDGQRRECTGDITHQDNVIEMAWEKPTLIFHLSTQYYHVLHIAEETNTVHREIFAPILLLPISPLMSAGKGLCAILCIFASKIMVF